MDKLETAEQAISNSIVFFKKEKFVIKKNVDTLILTLDIGHLQDIEEVSEIISFLSDFGMINRKTNRYGQEYHLASTANTNIKIKQNYLTKAFGYAIVEIESLEKLQRDLGQNISYQKGQFGRDVKEYIIDELFMEDIPIGNIKVKQLDLAIDIVRSSSLPEQVNFEDFCRNLSTVILNMNFPYLEADKQRGLNTGYFKSKSSTNKRIRMYNKRLKEEKMGKGNYLYESTFRFEYIFDKGQVKRHMGGRDLLDVDFRRGVGKIVKTCRSAINKNKEKLKQFKSEDLPQQGERMFEKYAVPVGEENLYEESWKLGVNWKSMINGNNEIFASTTNNMNYQKRMTMMYSYIKLIMDRDMEYYFDLFDSIISQLEKDLNR